MQGPDTVLTYTGSSIVVQCKGLVRVLFHITLVAFVLACTS